MKKKEILVFFLVLATSFIGAGFWYFCNLQKQTSVFKKESSEFNTVQQNQIDNLVNLITFDWAIYQNDKFGFRFKHPEYVYICEMPFFPLEKTELFLGIYSGTETCKIAKEAKDPPDIRIIIKKNINNYKTSEDAFYQEFPYIDKSINAHLKYFKINKFDAYGGEVLSGSKMNEWLNYSSGYGAIIFKNDLLIIISDSYYSQIYDGKQMGNKAVFDVMLDTFYFDTFRYWNDSVEQESPAL